MKFIHEIEPGNACPWWLGFVRDNCARHLVICCPIPFNWPLRWLWNIHRRLAYPVPDWTLIEERDRAQAEADHWRKRYADDQQAIEDERRQLRSLRRVYQYMVDDLKERST